MSDSGLVLNRDYGVIGMNLDDIGATRKAMALGPQWYGPQHTATAFRTTLIRVIDSTMGSVTADRVGIINPDTVAVD